MAQKHAQSEVKKRHFTHNLLMFKAYFTYSKS